MINLIIDNNINLKSIQDVNARDLFLLIENNRDYLSEFLNWVPFINLVEDEQEYVESLKNDETNVAFAILYENRVIGSIGFICIDNLNKNAQLGYCIDKDFQGKGIITKACKKIIEYGFQELELERIEFRIVKDNIKSKAVMERLSADFEGISRKSYFLNGAFVDCEIYSLLKN